MLDRWRSGTFGEIIEDWQWILTYTRQYKWAVAFYTLCGIVSASLSLLSAVAGKFTIDIITGKDMSRLGAAAAMMVTSMLVSLLLRSIISRMSARISLSVSNDIRATVFEKVMEADWLEISRYLSGDILNRFSGDTSTVAGNAISWLPDVAIGIYSFITTFFVIWHYDRVMALLALASAPFLLLSSRWLIRRMRRHNEEMREMSSRLMSFESESFGNLDTIKSFGLTERSGRKLREIQEEYRRVSLAYNLFSIQTNAALSLLGSAVQFAAFGYCLYLLWSGRIAYGTMTLFLSQSSRLSSTFSNLVGLVPAFLSSSVSAHRIRELTQLKREQRLPESSTLDQETAEGFEVRMEHLNFRYGQGETVISDSEFLARPGEIVALVGPSGEGKTTMIRLLLGLVRPEKGRVFLRAASGTEVEMNPEIRHLISYVPQGNTVMSGTIAENLRMVKEDAEDGELEEALRLACAWEFVSCMPEGIHSTVGERGRGLSEGQAQRISIARAILKDAPILLLDEATSALDVATERRVLRNIMTCRPGRTCIVTTHRPSVLNMCDRVYRVTDRRVTELTEEESGRLAMES